MLLLLDDDDGYEDVLSFSFFVDVVGSFCFLDFFCAPFFLSCGDSDTASDDDDDDDDEGENAEAVDAFELQAIREKKASMPNNDSSLSSAPPLSFAAAAVRFTFPGRPRVETEEARVLEPRRRRAAAGPSRAPRPRAGVQGCPEGGETGREAPEAEAEARQEGQEEEKEEVQAVSGLVL